MEETLELLKTRFVDKIITREIEQACVKIGNLGYRLSDDDYKRLEQRLKEIDKYKEAQLRIEGYDNSW
jgi:hypothetical protein